MGPEELGSRPLATPEVHVPGKKYILVQYQTRIPGQHISLLLPVIEPGYLIHGLNHQDLSLIHI